MPISRLAVALLLASTCGAALADVPEQTNGVYNFYIGAMFNATDDARQNVDHGYGVAGALNIPIMSWGERWAFEIAANASTLKTNKTQDTNYFRQALTGSLMYSFGDRDEFTPYVLAGAGYVHNDTNFLDEDGLTAHIGLGLTKLIGKTVRGRIEVQGLYDDFNSQDIFDTTISAGVEVPLGKVERVEIIREVEVIREVPAPAVAPIIKEVAPADSDNDGIADDRDQCPDTLAGVRTDNTGCAIAQAATLNNIEFDTNKATLTAASKASISEAAKFFEKQANLRAIIAGHTDDVGSDNSNQRLSLARAAAVRSALIAEGLDGKRFQAVGLGETMPLVTNDSAENRAKNRRVEFLLSISEAN